MNFDALQKMACVMVFGATGCTGLVSLGGDGGVGGAGQPDANPPEIDAMIPSLDAGRNADATAELDAAPELDAMPPDSGAPADAQSLVPSCGAICNGTTMTAAPAVTLDEIAGRWALCAGSLDLATDSGQPGLPQDTVGFEIDSAAGVAYMLVESAPGQLTRGIGPQYQFTVAINNPVRSTSQGVDYVNFDSNYSNVGEAYVATYFPSANGCTADLHLASVTLGLPTNMSDFVKLP